MRHSIVTLCQKLRGNRYVFGIGSIAMLPIAAMAAQIQRIKTDDIVVTRMAEQAPTFVLVVAVAFFVLSVAGFLMPSENTTTNDQPK